MANNATLKTEKVHRSCPKETERHVEVLLRATDILECFIKHDRLQLKELSELTGLNKSRIMRICGTLTCKNYLKYDERSKTYCLGSVFLVLGKCYETTMILFHWRGLCCESLCMKRGKVPLFSFAMVIGDSAWPVRRVISPFGTS